MIKIITANEIKTRGVSAITEATENGQEVFISVRGKNRYVVLSMDTYNHLRECELEAALIETRNDLKSGNYITESINDHIQRIKNT
ncbi:MAG: prevent-host-death protein [Spirochaetes bacterium GWF1_31_7]|nr:MAG: prevent-host-death protein [Spirochaetes bacterium GWE2_31_10]OHD49223.1 MAG: prevent-host-death protein [Spirochaetes bacterium GWF1_31_7]HBD95475.1 prevent-host-death protein [Spirochaetia bacterium]